MKSWWSKYKFFILGVSAIAAFFGLYGYLEYTRRLPDTRSLKTAYNINATNFVNQFENAEAAATIQYADKAISVEGIVGAIRTTDSSGTVFLNDGNSMASVMCQFGSTSLNEIKDLKRGQVVTIKGVCSGYLMDVVLVRCIIEK